MSETRNNKFRVTFTVLVTSFCLVPKVVSPLFPSVPNNNFGLIYVKVQSVTLLKEDVDIPKVLQ